MIDYSVSEYFPDVYTCYGGIYADYKGFSCCVIGTKELNSYLLFDEIYDAKSSSLGKIHKAIDKFQKYHMFDIKINKLKTLEEYFDKYGIPYKTIEFDVFDGIFNINSMLTDGLLRVPNKALAESLSDELRDFDSDITSHRVNALALALSEIDAYPFALNQI